jgi:hypothetical protein
LIVRPHPRILEASRDARSQSLDTEVAQFADAADPHQGERSNDLGFQQLDRSGDAGFDSLQEIVLN